MANNICFNLLIILILFYQKVNATSKNIVCYYASWTTYRLGNGKVTIEDINPNLCTHLIYSFVGLNEHGYVKILDSDNVNKNGMERFMSLKNINANLKVLIAMGGWNEGSKKYSKVINSPLLRKKLISSIDNFVSKHEFDGFDLDWEYPGQRGGSSTDRSAVVEFLKELRSEFDKSPKKLLITAAVGAAENLQASSYDIPMLNKYLDFVNLMTYDYYSTWGPVTKQNAPLYPMGNTQLSVDNTVRSWIGAGASPEKLIVGIALYGRTFTLSTSNTYLNAPVSGPGAKGKYSGENGILTFLEICENLKQDGWSTFWDDIQKVPYSYKYDQWIAYDDLQSVELKVNYAVDNNLGGVMVWSVDADDSKNICGYGRYPILSKIKATLHRDEMNNIVAKCYDFLPNKGETRNKIFISKN